MQPDEELKSRMSSMLEQDDQKHSSKWGLSQSGGKQEKEVCWVFYDSEGEMGR